MENFMRTRTVIISSLILAIAVFLCAGPLAAQPAEASRGHDVSNKVYAPSLTPAIYLVNFVFLYMAKPDLAAYLPAYKAPVPQPIVDCLEQHPEGCPYSDYSRYFDELFDNRECFWPEACQEAATFARLAPRKVTRREQLNEPLGRRRADQLAHLLGMDAGMILTDAEYNCLIGTPPRPPVRDIIFRCIYDLTNSNGNAMIPLSSYGLNVTEQGVLRSVCAPQAPCLDFNTLLGGPLEAIAAECGFLDKFLRVLAETPLLQFIVDGNPCQESGEPACLIETTCAGNGH